MNRQTAIIVEQIDNGFIGTVSGGNQALTGSGPSNTRRHYNSLAELAADAHNLIDIGFKAADAELEMRHRAMAQQCAQVQRYAGNGRDEGAVAGIDPRYENRDRAYD